MIGISLFEFQADVNSLVKGSGPESNRRSLKGALEMGGGGPRDEGV